MWEKAEGMEEMFTGSRTACINCKWVQEMRVWIGRVLYKGMNEHKGTDIRWMDVGEVCVDQWRGKVAVQWIRNNCMTGWRNYGDTEWLSEWLWREGEYNTWERDGREYPGEGGRGKNWECLGEWVTGSNYRNIFTGQNTRRCANCFPYSCMWRPSITNSIKSNENILLYITLY